MYHRCVIAKFDIVPLIQGDKRWTTPLFVQNAQDLWAPDHFQMICSAVDKLPPGLHFEVTRDLEAESSERSALSPQIEHFAQSLERLGLSRRLEGSNIANEPQIDNHPITLDASTHPVGRKKKRTEKTSR